jgi:hypothetical protein
MQTETAPELEKALPRDSLPAVLTFLRKFYGQSFYGADETYFDWQYLQAPCRWFAARASEGRLPVNAFRDANGTILALHAFIPFDACIDGGICRGVWDAEWINGSGIRGLGRRLATALLDDSDVYGGFAMNNMADQSFHKLGLTIFPEIQRRVAVLDRPRLADQLFAAGCDAEATALPDETGHGQSGFFVLDSTAAIPASVYETYGRMTSFHVNRDPEWMAWRFDTHPFIKYTSVASDPDGADGVAVTRLENVVGTPHVVCRIVEFIAEPGKARALLESVLSYARSNAALIADYFTTSQSYARQFDETTQCLAMGMQANPRVPYMYQPLAFNQRNAMNFAIAVSAPFRERVRLEDFQACKCDTDQDILRSPETAPAM